MHRMPVGAGQWRAGIGRYNRELCSKAIINIHVSNLIAIVCYAVAYLHSLIWISVITLPFSILASSFFSLFAPCGSCHLIIAQRMSVCKTLVSYTLKQRFLCS